MHITFGLNFDSHQGPSRESYFAAPVVGRKGLLGLLETYLGLARREVSVARRVTSYLGHLQKWDDQNRFYSESLQADSVGTAAKLLSWRDEWRLGGWNGSAPDDAPRRLRELAMIEQSACGDIAPGEAERLAAVEAALATERTPIESVLLVDPIESFPRAWRKVLDLLPNVKIWHAQPQGEGQLRALQELAQKALAEGQLPAPLPSVTDGSVMLLQASARETTEHWLSAWCLQKQVDRLIVCESLGDAVDATLNATGGASCGFENPSELRPALQAVGLALEMCWSPVDTGRLVEFLSHPIGPFSRRARASLGRAVAEQPGIGGEAWTSARTELAASEGGEAILGEVAFWLEGESWTREAGAPIDALEARVERVREAHRRRLTGDGALAATFVPAIEQCSAILDGLTEFKNQGFGSLVPRQVEQLILHATPAGAANPEAVAQVGCMRSAGFAATCIEPAEEVIWWMPSTPILSPPLPWSVAETTALAQLGVELRDPQQELALLAQQWLRPLLVARKRFLLVLPPPDAEEHPFRQLVLKLAPDLKAGCIDLDADVNGAYVGTLAVPLKRVDLPETPRYIELKTPAPLPKEPQSYTSLAELFNHPALFNLKRVARLNSTSVLSAEEDNRLLGTLAHRVFEKLFQHADVLAWSNQRAVDWFRANIDELLRAEGAPLLMQGAGLSQQRFKAICEGAIGSLLDHLRAAGAVSVRTEVKFDGVLGDILLTGKVDLLIELSGSRTVALDMKWKRDGYYAGVLLDGRHLQLALYATLIEQKAGAAPAALGYFIVESGSMFVTAADVFPGAQVRVPRNNITVVELLQQAKESWKWRASQWEVGQIEVVPRKGLDEFQGPPGTLPVESVGPWHNDHLVLLGGWEK